MFKNKKLGAFIALICGGLCFFFFTGPKKVAINVTPSLLMGGYDANRSAHTQASMDPHSDHIWIELARDEIFKNASERNPIYWNGLKPDARFLKGRRALIVSTGKGLHAWDLDKSEWIWKVDLPEKNQGTPVLDPDTGIIYLSARNLDQFDQTRIIEFSLYGVHIEGRLEFEKKVPATFWSSPEDHPLHGQPVPRVNCHTAMGLNRNTQPKKLFLGCAIRTLPLKEGYRYRDDRGVTGRVLFIDLGEKGEFGKLGQFYTSQWSENPNFGFDSGVYNSGSGPTLLHDDTILVSTGNGPFNSKAGNFGCSVIRVDSKTGKVVVDPQGNPLSFSLSPEPYQECWSQNWDLGSSGVSAQRVSGDRWIGAVMSKHSNIIFFDADRMNQEEGRIEIFEVGWDSYGSPTSRILDDGRVQFLFQFSTPKKGYRTSTHFLGSKEIFENSWGAQEKVCIGWTAKKPESSTRPLQLLYSGPLLKRYTYVFSDSKVADLRTKTFSEKRVGWHSNWAHPKLKIPFQPHGEIGHFWTRPVLEGLKKLEASKYFRVMKNEKFPDVYYIPNDDDQDCESNKDPNHQPLYVIEQYYRKEKDPGYHIQSYIVDSDLKWERSWDYWAKDLFIHQTSLSMWTNPESGKTYAASLVLEPETTNAQLLIVDADKGRAVVRKEVPDISHFASPMAVDEFLVVPTKNQGLFIYKFQYGPGDPQQVRVADDYFEKSQVHSYRISPDGQHLAFLAPYDSKVSLFVKPIDGGASTKVSGSSDQNVSSFFWKGNGTLLFSRNLEEGKKTQLFRVSLEGGGEKDLMNSKETHVQIIDALENIDPDHILVCLNKRDKNMFDAYRLNIYSGELKKIAQNPGDFTAWFADREGKLRVATSTSDGNTSLYYRHTEDQKFEKNNTNEEKAMLVPIFFTFDSKRLYMISNLNRNNSAIVIYDPIGKKEVRPVFEKEGEDITGLGYSNIRKKTLYATFGKSKKERHFFDEETEAMFSDIQAKLQSDDFSITSSDLDESLYVVKSDKTEKNGSFYLYDAEAKTLKFLSLAR